MPSRSYPNPAAQASASLSGPMAILAAGVVESVNAIGGSLAAAREDRQVYAYANALQASRQRANQLEAVARVALSQVTDLELEVASLRRALEQRAEVIAHLTGKMEKRA